MNTKTIDALSPHVLAILLALAGKERHGYEIMKHVAETSQGNIQIGPGTLYSALKRLLKDGWVELAGERELVDKEDERRKYYHLTPLGKKRLGAELQRYQEVLAMARASNLEGLVPEL
ncbi:PadR family transcriptional regulator [Ktedonobacteria bacterium brp13]|nr:PadR family transcriptional regulator [Ktedonobacteria bacterium brp13]